MVGIIAAVLLVSGAGVAAYAAIDFTTSFTSDAVDLEGQESVPPDIGAIEGGVNLFLAGTDACEPEYASIFGERCTGPDAEVELNDVNMLVHISDEPRKVTVISFPRDLMVPIPECTDEDGTTTEAITKAQINEAYGIGGLACVTKTVSALSGQNIPFAAKITWGGVIEITNAIGPVEVCLASGIRDRFTGIDWPAGTREVVGVDALQFLRTRHGVGDGSDLGRIANQQQYMSRLARKVVSAETLTNPTTLLTLARTAVENITPSRSLTNPMTLAQIALAVKNVPFEDIAFVQYPVLEDPFDTNRVVPDEDSAAALWAALEANESVSFTNEAGSFDGTVADPNAAVTPTPTPAEASPEASPSASPTPAPTSVALPENVKGSTAAEATCSNGNLRGFGG
ncbi:LCP family glycopolymer transferase [Microbacterium hominis]|uniref:LCP family glycopolymer transferase n=1 Tax=Microbacterium hominis TaxID=162426 RepID=UPI0020B8CCD9|nr:LCP family protein [Microbacterium hominis]